VSALETVTAFFDLELRLDVLAPDVEFRPLTGQVIFGPAGVAAALDDIAQQFRDYDVAPVELTPVSDEVVLVALRRTGLTHRGDVPVTDTFAQLFRVRDRLIVRIESFKTLGEARQAIA
jgi:ketosteroid isomerase-like protein